jgi:hypothetical protein
MIATLEHRFFGLSLPFGNESYLPENMKSALTLDNIIADSVSFFNWIKETVPGAEESKTIIVGSKFSFP